MKMRSKSLHWVSMQKFGEKCLKVTVCFHDFQILKVYMYTELVPEGMIFTKENAHFLRVDGEKDYAHKVLSKLEPKLEPLESEIESALEWIIEQPGRITWESEEFSKRYEEEF